MRATAALRHVDRTRDRARRRIRCVRLHRRACHGRTVRARRRQLHRRDRRARKRRSWMAARRPSWPPSIRPASRRCRRRAAISRCSKPVRVAAGDAFGELRPYDRGFRVDVEIEFDHPLIGRQSLALDVEPAAFRREIARARTFGFMRDVVEAVGRGLCARRLAGEHGGGRPRTACSIRRACASADEFVRHKVLDAIGDLALAGAPILGAYRSVRGGHKLNHAVLAALLADPTAWTMVEAAARRPRPRRRRPCRGGPRRCRPVAADRSRLNPGRLPALEAWPPDRLSLLICRSGARLRRAGSLGGDGSTQPHGLRLASSSAPSRRDAACAGARARAGAPASRRSAPAPCSATGSAPRTTRSSMTRPTSSTTRACTC